MTANSSFTEISAITYRHFKNKYVTDNVSNHTALHQRLTEKDRVDLISGGWEIQVPLDYAENGTYQRYSGYDTLDIAQSEVFTAANFSWKQVAINVVASGLEVRQNAGKEGVIKLVKNKLKNAMKTAGNNFSSDMYSDGTAANQINGLQALVSDAGTGTVGGINSSTYTFWKSGLQSAAAPIQGGGAITPSATTIESLMLPLWLQLTRNNDQPDLIVMDDTYFTFFDNSQTSIQRYTNTTDLKTGTTSLKLLLEYRLHRHLRPS
jgi:hypothetical protein